MIKVCDFLFLIFRGEQLKQPEKEKKFVSLFVALKFYWKKFLDYEKKKKRKKHV